jgi:hypothetical protein
MVHPTGGTRMLWESTCCVLRRQKLTLPSRSKSISRFLILELRQSSYRCHPICPTSNRMMSQWPSAISALHSLCGEKARHKDQMFPVWASLSYTVHQTIRKA